MFYHLIVGAIFRNAEATTFDSLAIGFVVSILSTSILFLGMLVSFVSAYYLFHSRYTCTNASTVMYTLGIIVSLIGTGFLIGFFQQLKLMFKPVRIVATIVFFGSIGMVFVAAFILGNPLLCIIMVIVEFLAYT